MTGRTASDDPDASAAPARSDGTARRRGRPPRTESAGTRDRILEALYGDSRP